MEFLADTACEPVRRSAHCPCGPRTGSHRGLPSRDDGRSPFRILTLLACLGFLTATAEAQPKGNPRLAPYPEGRFSALTKESINTYFDAEGAYKAGEYDRAARILADFWKRHPPGTEEWENASGDAATLADATGANFGSPVGYYALRMLTDCARWRTAGKDKPGKAFPVVWTVVLVGKSAGVEPRTPEELQKRTGVRVEHALDPRLAANDYEVLRQSQWLLLEYVAAMTSGNLAVKVEFLALPGHTAPVEAAARPVRSAQLTGAGIDGVFKDVPEATRLRTDWWFLVHPSHVPSKHAPFAKAEFVTGGMGSGPDGKSPLFLVDDLWLVRKPPHLGRGDYTEWERRLYLPQW